MKLHVLAEQNADLNKRIEIFLKYILKKEFWVEYILRSDDEDEYQETQVTPIGIFFHKRKVCLFFQKMIEFDGREWYLEQESSGGVELLVQDWMKKTNLQFVEPTETDIEVDGSYGIDRLMKLISFYENNSYYMVTPDGSTYGNPNVLHKLFI